MIFKQTKNYVIYDTPNELVEEREKNKYGGYTRGEVILDLRNLDEYVEGLAGTGDVEEIWDIVKHDKGMVEVLYEMYLEEMCDEDRGELFFKPADSFPRRLVKVKEMLYEKGTLPREQIYAKLHGFRTEYPAADKVA